MITKTQREIIIKKDIKEFICDCCGLPVEDIWMDFEQCKIRLTDETNTQQVNYDLCKTCFTNITKSFKYHPEGVKVEQKI